MGSAPPPDAGPGPSLWTTWFRSWPGTQTPQLVVGDGAQLCYDALTAAGIPAVLAPPNLRMQSAWGVARQALALAQAGQTLSPAQLVPVYHRLSQAERERLEREQAAQTPHPQ